MALICGEYPVELKVMNVIHGNSYDTQICNSTEESKSVVQYPPGLQHNSIPLASELCSHSTGARRESLLDVSVTKQVAFLQFAALYL